jgi:cytochrome c-type biogenesis protein CcmH/NrfG
MAKRDGPITRQKERIAFLRTRLAEIDRERARIVIQLDEAENALAMLTGKPAETPRLPLEERADA